MDKPEIEVVRRVYSQDTCCGPAFIRVQPNPDAPSNSIMIASGDNKSSEEYYGKISLIMFDEDAKALAEQILACYNEKEKER